MLQPSTEQRRVNKLELISRKLNVVHQIERPMRPQYKFVAILGRSLNLPLPTHYEEGNACATCGTVRLKRPK